MSPALFKLCFDTLVVLVVFGYFDEDWCHTQRGIMTRLTHDECTVPWSSTTRDATTFSPLFVSPPAVFAQNAISVDEHR